MQLLPLFILALHNNGVSSQIIYSISRQVPFPSWLICLGCHNTSMRAGLVGYLYWRRLQKTCVIISILPLKCVILGQISCSSGIHFLSRLSCKIFAVSETSLNGQIFKCISGNSTVQILWRLVCIRKAHLALYTTKLQSYWRGGCSAAWDWR